MFDITGISDQQISRKLRHQMNITEVSLLIEKIKADKGFETYREACLEYLETCKENIDFSDLAKLISPTLKMKLHQEAIDDGFIRGVGEGSLDGFFET